VFLALRAGPRGSPARGRARPAGRGRRHEPGRHQRPRAARHHAVRLRCRGRRRRRARRSARRQGVQHRVRRHAPGRRRRRQAARRLPCPRRRGRQGDSGRAGPGGRGCAPIDAGRFARARELDLEALGYLHMAVQPSFSDATVATVSSVGRAHPTATTFDEATYASTTPLRVATPVQAPRPSSSTRRGAGHRCRDDRPLRTTEPGSLVWSCGARGAAAPPRSTPAPRLAPLYVGGCSTSIAPIPIRAIGRETQVRGAPR